MTNCWHKWETNDLSLFVDVETFLEYHGHSCGIYNCPAAIGLVLRMEARLATYAQLHNLAFVPVEIDDEHAAELLVRCAVDNV